MYQRFFGFKDKPFQLVPNPAYLFLSRLHEEAFAHLSYAVSNGDGFVRITGEVGTGKTTLCRAFLENLNENTAAAYIFNPKLDAFQLLKTVNQEFGIPADAGSIKDLIDALNGFLIAEKAKGRHVVLLIDEAQNLSIEVLEQIRLLSNLETTRSKLLQIILVGQPELQAMLDSPELRQLGQRITLSCSLSPLTLAETGDYIRHRLQIASRKPGIRFPPGAVRAIFRYSSGIPRLINIACDRTLLTAYGMNRNQITGKIARSAIRELAGIQRPRGAGSLLIGNRGIFVFPILCLVLLAVLLHPPDIPILLDRQSASIREKTVSPLLSAHAERTPPGLKIKAETVPPAAPEDGNPHPRTVALFEQAEATPPEPEKAESTPPEPEKAESTPKEEAAPQIEDLGKWLAGISGGLSRTDAVKAVLKLWKEDANISPHLPAVEDNQRFFRMILQHSGFSCQNVSGDLDLIRKLDLPAVIELLVPDGRSKAYMTVCRLQGDRITLNAAGAGPIVTSIEEVKTFWSGVAFVPWKNFLSCTGEIPVRAPKESVITLKMMLKDMGFSEIRIDSLYDGDTRGAVKRIQNKHGLKADGLVGPLTKIILYNESGSFAIPHILAEGSNGSASKAPRQ
ncbi:MAG: AAA family ATPase [Desulfobacteraceae bacterium]|nr:MAG: AAA family ATPase [Desulfobacteraceae bacterium]